MGVAAAHSVVLVLKYKDFPVRGWATRFISSSGIARLCGDWSKDSGKTSQEDGKRGTQHVGKQMMLISQPAEIKYGRCIPNILEYYV